MVFKLDELSYSELKRLECLVGEEIVQRQERCDHPDNYVKAKGGYFCTDWTCTLCGSTWDDMGL